MNSAQHLKNMSDAIEMGVAHFKAGGKPASATDKNFSRFIKEYSTPDWSLTGQLLQVMAAWQKGWHGANLASESE